MIEYKHIYVTVFTYLISQLFYGVRITFIADATTSGHHHHHHSVCKRGVQRQR